MPMQIHSGEIDSLLTQITDLKAKLSEARRRLPTLRLEDFELTRPDGSPVRLSTLFAGKPDMLFIHNMGRGCVYCTMWADGINGLAAHLDSRAALVVASPDQPEVVRAFASSRRWTFPMVSVAGSGITKALGFEPEPGKVYPGVSALRRDTDGAIHRVGMDVFGPGDDYCAAWRLFDLLQGGVGAWEPKYTY